MLQRFAQSIPPYTRTKKNTRGYRAPLTLSGTGMMTYGL